MKFRSYCMLVLGKTDGCIDEITKIAERVPKVLPAKGINITTFVSAFSPMELEDYFKGYGRNFFLFEIDPTTSGYNINNEAIRDNLFAHLISGKGDLEEMSNRMIEDINMITNSKPISGSSKGIIVESKTRPLRVNKEDYEGLNYTEKQELINDILDKGFIKLSDRDKEILELLGKK